MKHLLYIPFLILLAVTYTRVSENISEIEQQPIPAASRWPASIDAILIEDCVDLPSRFNPHFNSKNCY